MSGKNYRNVISYLNDLPNDDQLSKIRNLSKEELDNIASDNVAIWPFVYNGTICTIAITMRIVKPGEQLGYAYEDRYWKIAPEKRAVFNINGDIIGHFESPDRINMIPSFKPSADLISERCTLSNITPLVPILKKPSLDEFDYQSSFKANVNYSLDIFLSYFRDNVVLSEFLKNAKEKFNTPPSVPTAYNVIHGIFNKLPEDEAFKVLKPLRSEIIFHMTRYNSCKAKPQARVGEPRVIRSALGGASVDSISKRKPGLKGTS